jgi:hypothetical protein
VDDLVQHNDDAFDALIASLVARANALGLCGPVPDECLDEARVEGWISLPEAGSLAKLPGPAVA